MKRQKIFMIERCLMKLLNLEIKFMVISRLKKVGLSFKLTSFWKGPYTVIGNFQMFCIGKAVVEITKFRSFTVTA